MLRLQLTFMNKADKSVVFNLCRFSLFLCKVTFYKNILRLYILCSSKRFQSKSVLTNKRSPWVETEFNIQMASRSYFVKN